MIRVVANLAWIVPGRVGGSEEYSVRLLRAVMDAAPPDIELGIVASRRVFDAHREIRPAALAELGGPVDSRLVRLAVESTRVRALTADADVAHHFGGRLPARRAARPAHVVTVHDLQPLHLPDNFSWIKRRYLEWALPRSVRSAALVATPSAWVGSTVASEFGIDRARIRTVPSTWDDDTNLDPSAAGDLGPGPVVLYPAVTHPHKRHRVLLDALPALTARRPDLRIVLTGGAGRAEAEVAAAVQSRAVVRLGRVSAPTLRGLLARADVLAFPSVYEGFGLPVLEAMRSGTPVVAAPSGGVAEVMGETGTVVHRDTPAAWAEAIDAALSTPAAALAAARSRAEAYAPAAAAERLVALWRDAAAHASTTP